MNKFDIVILRNVLSFCTRGYSPETISMLSNSLGIFQREKILEEMQEIDIENINYQLVSKRFKAGYNWMIKNDFFEKYKYNANACPKNIFALYKKMGIDIYRLEMECNRMYYFEECQTSFSNFEGLFKESKYYFTENFKINSKVSSAFGNISSTAPKCIKL